MNSEMMNMGHKIEKSEVQSMTSGMMYPTINLCHNIPSGLEDKSVGDVCNLQIIGKIKRLSESEDGEKSMDIEVHKMGYIGKAKLSKEEYNKMSDEEKDKADEEDVMSGDDEGY